MKKMISRWLLILLLCVSAQAAKADGTTVWSEDFNQATIPSLTDAGWSFVGSRGFVTLYNNEDNSTQRLRIGSSDPALATTPAIGTAGHLILTFNYTGSTANATTFSISVTEGSISGAPTEFSFNNETYSSATFNINNATASTQIVFTTQNSGVYIDNIVVQAEGVAPTPVTVAAPTFSLPEGRYTESQTLTISCETDGATIYYTTDGTQPTNESTPYSGAITISESQTVKAIAYKGETASNVTTAEYFIGNTLFLEEFAGETDGYKALNGTSYMIEKQDIGRSAILTFQLRGRNASSSATLRVIENYEENNTQKYRTIINDAVISPTQNEWTTYKYALPMMYDNSTITLSIASSNCNLDDVILVTPPTITLDQNADNSSVLTANINNIVDVATVRTLRGGIWNTLCLPFDINRSGLYTALGVSQYLVMTTFSSYANNVMTFSTVTGDAVIMAGTPFLLKCNTDCVNPTFRAVTIARATPQAVTDNGVTFQGCFWRTPLNTDGTDLFLGTDNYLYIPAVGTNTLGGLRAYIHLGSSGVRPVLTFEDEATMIREKDAVGHAKTVYTLQGQRVVKPKRGLYVSEGKKFVVK